MSKSFKKFKPKAVEKTEDTGYHSDYPKEPFGGSNPYYCCSFCKLGDPQINGKIENHASWCEYRISKETRK